MLSHLRTWRSWLWKKIKEDDLKDENGVYWSVAGDLAFMYPMYEMSGQEHYRYVDKITYIYNDRNPINDHKVNLGGAIANTTKLKGKEPYKKL
jgi:hypothetical protein